MKKLQHPCDVTEAKGTLEEVGDFLGLKTIWDDGTTGNNIIIAICDTGVNRTSVPKFSDGWSPNASFPPGTDSASHGTMCAHDASFVCPDAEIYDIGVLKGTQGVAATLSDALMGYDWLISRSKSTNKFFIASNSWGIYQESWAPDYARDSNHPFTRKVKEAIKNGILVCFAAGNCGPICPSRRCESDIGSGRSIWGANGLAEVFTIGGANLREEWIGYSSIGPASLSDKKPDFCSLSHFKGFYEVDTGTSAATPIAAAVIALLKDRWTDLDTSSIKEAIFATCHPLCSDNWDYYSGAGLLDAKATYLKLKNGGDDNKKVKELCESLAEVHETLEKAMQIIENAQKNC
jgi:subtilisin family serine protease